MSKSISEMSPSWRVTPIEFARVRTTPSVCGWQLFAAKKPRFLPRPIERHIAIASAAAVASSSSDEPASGSPVRSAMTVWKLSSASSLPCEISAWYGVYCVYQPGFSRMLRWITGGTMTSE